MFVKRKVLIVAYGFPPTGGGGVQRPAKFVKYLPDFGWQPYVITTDESVWTVARDETLLADIPADTPVWRIPTPMPRPRTWMLETFPWLQRAIEMQGGWRSVLGRLVRWALFPLGLVEYPPVDGCFWWALRIVPLALRLIRQEKIDVIFATCPPWSVNISGLLIQVLTRKLWVVDFRDPWTRNTFIYKMRGWKHRVSRWVESLTVQRANAITCAWPMDDLIVGLRQFLPKRTVIYNGYDGEDFESLTVLGSSDVENAKIRLLHIGTLYREFSQALLVALHKLQSENFMALEKLSIQITGEAPEVLSLIRELNLPTARFVLTPRLPHSEVLLKLMNVEVLLLLLPATEHGRAVSSGKLYEYLASGVPILAVVPEGNAAAIVYETGTGCVVHPEDTEGLVEILRLIATDYPAFRARYFHPRPEVIQRFERRALTGQLAEVFNGLCAGEGVSS